MSERLRIDVFCEDRAHEELLTPLIRRLCAQEHVEAAIAVRSARGGHGKALHELRLYQQVVVARGLPRPDLLVVAIDTNCASYAEAAKQVSEAADPACSLHCAAACPNPHIELWYMADPGAFQQVVGVVPPPLEPECGKASRNVLKRMLAHCVKAAGHPVIFGGIQFASELADAMDLHVAGRADAGLHHFVRDVVAALRRLKQQRRPNATDGPSGSEGDGASSTDYSNPSPPG